MTEDARMNCDVFFLRLCMVILEVANLLWRFGTDQRKIPKVQRRQIRVPTLNFFLEPVEFKQQENESIDQPFDMFNNLVYKND